MADKKDQGLEAVATPRENAKLDHTRDGVTTRDDLLDAGVPMLAGSPKERQGPEDAAGGVTRGDYSERIGGSDYHPHTSELIPEDEREEGGPIMRLVPQRPIFAQTGDTKGKKGGVENRDEAV